MEAEWEKLSRIREVKCAFHQAANAGKKLFEKNINSLQMKWMEMEGGEVIRVRHEEIKENGAIFAQAFSMGVTVQVLDRTANKVTVIRIENEEEIRDVVYIGEASALSGIVFLTPRKAKEKGRARDISPSLAPKRRGRPQSGLSLEIL